MSETSGPGPFRGGRRSPDDDLAPETKLATERLEASELRFHSLVDQLDAIVWQASADPMRFTYVSRKAESMTGQPAERWLGGIDAWTTLLHPDDRDRVVNARMAAATRGEDHTLDYRIISPNGREAWLRDIARVFRDEHGGAATLVGIILDITESRGREMPERVLVEAIERTSDMIFVTDELARIRTFNPALTRQCGYSAAELLGKTPRIFKSGLEDPGVYQELWSTITSGKVWHGKLWNRRKDGSIYHEDKTIAPVVAHDGSLSGYVSIGRDVTRQEELEAKWRDRQRFEAIGQLAGGVAHDFNNILQIISTSIELAADLAESEAPKIAEELAEAKRAIVRAGGITRQLLAFSRRQALDLQPIALNSVVEGLGNMLHRLFKENIRLIFELDPALPRVMGDHAQLEQVLLNLCLNARDAMPDGGELKLRSHVQSLASDGDLAAGEYVCISVSDDGTGMSDAIRSRVFEPFFTTKQSGKGSGLGLPMSFGIVRQHGGAILVVSEERRGSTFTMVLPACATDSPADVDATPATDRRFRGTETILVAEDEGRILALLTKALESRGYTILTAADGEEALEVYRENVGRVALAILDVVMPKLGGTRVSREIRLLDPRFPVIFCSGYGEELVGLEPDDAMALVSKPVDVNLLAGKIRFLLDRDK